MNVEDFISTIRAEFFAGVPDSLLNSLGIYLMKRYGNNNAHHIIAANEGIATALAAGYYLATNKVPVVYMQNSGEGNVVNPATSLLSDKVYGIPVIFVIGWRGEPSFKDEPQHIFQGAVTLKLLEDLNISYFILRAETSLNELEVVMEDFRKILSAGKQVAFVVSKGALSCNEKMSRTNNYKIIREDAIRIILEVSADDVVVSTTGKISRELFFIREGNEQGHNRDFMTVGSMGYASSVALGIALQKPNKKIWCIDGDGAFLMHMGALSSIGSNHPKNFVHVVLNNESHESVGGFPTSSGTMNLPLIAKSCGYEYVACVDSPEDLENILRYVKSTNVLSFIEVKTALSLNSKVGRPTTTPKSNKDNFMKFLSDD